MKKCPLSAKGLRCVTVQPSQWLTCSAWHKQESNIHVKKILHIISFTLSCCISLLNDEISDKSKFKELANNKQDVFFKH